MYNMQEMAQVASWVEWDRPGIPEIMKLSQEDEEFKTNLNHIMRLSQHQNISGIRLSSAWPFLTLPSSLHVLETFPEGTVMAFAHTTLSAAAH